MKTKLHSLVLSSSFASCDFLQAVNKRKSKLRSDVKTPHSSFPPSSLDNSCPVTHSLLRPSSRQPDHCEHPQAWMLVYPLALSTHTSSQSQASFPESSLNLSLWDLNSCGRHWLYHWLCQLFRVCFTRPLCGPEYLLNICWVVNKLF